MTKIKERISARDLRRLGISIGVIAKKLNLGKGTISYWCRDIELSQSQKNRILKNQKEKSRKTLQLAAIKRHNQKLKIVQNLSKEGISQVGNINKRDLFVAGLALYWAEGYKKGNEELGFTNTDPKMILFFIKWLEKIYDIDKKDLTFRVSINFVHHGRIDKVLNYWSNLIKVPIKQFTTTSFVKTKSKKKYDNFDNYFGTLRLKVKRGTNLRRKIIGSISGLANY